MAGWETPLTTIRATVRRLLSPFLVVAAVASLGLSACNSSPTAAAKVNGTVISQKSLDDELSAIKQNKQYVEAITSQGAPPVDGQGKGTYNSAFVAQILNQRILLTVVHQELEKRKITASPEDLRLAAIEVKSNFELGDGSASLADAFPKSYQTLLAQRSADVELLEASLSNTKIDAPAVTNYYNDHKSDYSETCVRHILVDSMDKATAIKAQLAAGGDFAAIAKAQSTDTSSGAKGGDLGCDISQFVQEFKDAASKLPVNQVSDPVQTQFGFHIIQVTSRKDKPLDDTIRVQIRQQLVQAGSSQIQDVVYGAIAKGKITVNPRIGTFKPGNADTGEPPQVVPNLAPGETTSTEPPAELTPTSAPGATPTTTAPAAATTTTAPKTSTTTAPAPTTTAKP